MSQILMQASEVNANNASAQVQIDSREYQIYVGKSFVSVATGNAISLRSTGKAFHEDCKIAKHYKKDGSTILGIVSEMRLMIADAASLVR
jgi:hypothetical protein